MSNDLISRQAAIEAIEEHIKEDTVGADWYNMVRRHMKELIEVLPSARRTGKWTKENACEFCGFQPWYENDIHTLSFCPNCGAKMDGERKDDATD